MHIKRDVLVELERWREKPARKPLILRGARQVGKTTVVKEFSSQYTHAIMLNLERAQDLEYFKDFSDAQTLVEALMLAHNISLAALQDTLLFIDEIQESPEAIALLRYFYEDVPGLPVIAAGSLLEHAMKKVQNFPVGRVEFLYLQPLNFQEFLVAKEHSGALDALNSVPVATHAHRVLKDLFHEYAIVGGMPEVVKHYVQSGSLVDLPPIYESIWETYRVDVEKYASTATESRVIKHIIKTAALQLDQRIKFQNFGNSNYRSREVGEAMHQLHDSRVIQMIYPTTATEPPIMANMKKSPRLQLLDTGLVNHELKIQGKMLALEDLSEAFRGRVIPHLITQEWISLQKRAYELPHFWVREKTQSHAEVDLVVQHDDKVIPIEVKSGATGSLKSLHQFIERCDHPYAVRMYAGDLSINEHVTPTTRKSYYLMNLPYYLGTKLPEYLDYFLSEEWQKRDPA